MKPTKEQLADPKWWQEYFIKKYNYEPSSGTIKNRFGKIISKKNKGGYVVINTRVDWNRYEFLAHRVAFLMIEGRWPIAIDHINGNTSDNSWINMREVSHSENMKNQKLYKNNKTGVVGLQSLKGAFLVSIQSEGDREHIGSFADFFEACCARKSAEIRYGFHENHGRFDLTEKDGE